MVLPPTTSSEQPKVATSRPPWIMNYPTALPIPTSQNTVLPCTTLPFFSFMDMVILITFSTKLSYQHQTPHSQCSQTWTWAFSVFYFWCFSSSMDVFVLTICTYNHLFFLFRVEHGQIVIRSKNMIEIFFGWFTSGMWT